MLVRIRKYASYGWKVGKKLEQIQGGKVIELDDKKAQDLIQRGIADPVEEVPTPAAKAPQKASQPAKTPDPVKPDEDLSEKTVKELREIAVARGVKNASRKSKAELIAELEGTEEAATVDVNPESAVV